MKPILLTLLLATCSSFLATAQRPNIILIFADDQGYQDMSCFGHPKIKTPNMDRLAKEGRKFTDFYSVNPVCSASRAGLMTGCYPTRVGIQGVLFPNHTKGLNPNEITIAEILKEKGYTTACIGKWHLGHLPEFLPTSQGFDSYFGIPYSNDMGYDPKMATAKDIVLRDGVKMADLAKAKGRKPLAPLMRNKEVVEVPSDQRTLTKRYTEEAIKFITANKEGPFFLYFPHTMPHIPLFVTPEFKGVSAGGLYGDVIEEMDWSVGEILKTVKSLGIDEKTLIVYTSDNGPWLSVGARGGSALPLRGGKFTTYEGGVREPTLMRWPGKIPAGTVCSEVASTIDLLPTFAKLAGGAAPTDRVIDGRDIWPLISATEGAKSPHAAFFYYKGNTLEAVRAGKWKYRSGPLDIASKKAGKKGKETALFDLEADKSESTNLIKKHPEVAERLKKLIVDFDQERKANSRPAGARK